MYEIAIHVAIYGLMVLHLAAAIGSLVWMTG